MLQENQTAALRKIYSKTLLIYAGTSLLFMATAFMLAYSPLFSIEALLPWLIAAWIGIGLAVSEYFIERALYKRGKKGSFLLFGFVLGISLLYAVFTKTGVLGGYTDLLLPLVLGFLFNRPVVPAIILLSDYRRLRDGDLRETVGRIKSGTHRKNTEAGRGAYVLFEDELTHEVHLLHMGHISPLHRYRVFFLPHSGLAVGEVIPDHVTFDPFGNPIEREAEAEERPAEKPAYSEESYAEKAAYSEASYAEKAGYTEESYKVKPDYTEEESAEKPWYQNPEAFSANPPKSEPKEDTSIPDPNSPERIKAARFGAAAKVFKVLTFVFFGGMFLGALMAKEDLNPGFMLLAIPFFVTSIILSEVFKSKELKIRCTRRTTSFCVDTVRRKSGKHSHRYPIVEFEVGGVTHTVELSITCSRDAVGDIYTLYYDPLDPDVVRPERRGLYD